MKTFFKLIVTFSLLTLSSQISHSQSISREVQVEQTVHNFQQNYNMGQKLIDSTSVSSTSTINQDLFKRFIRNEMHPIFNRNFQGILKYTINPSMLQGIYDDEFDGFMLTQTTLLTKFTTWKNNLTNVSSHGHSHGAEAGNCNNVDFELGSYTHWMPSRGDVQFPGIPPFIGAVQNITAGTAGVGSLNAQHYIVSSGMDPDCPAVPRVNPRGGTYSLRLGDETAGYKVAIITHEVLITQAKPYFTYDFAVVFQDPSHPATDQPFFNVEFLDSTNTKIPSCGNYFVVTGSAVPGFITNGQWRYKPWSRITVDLNTYVGQRVTVKFTVADCGYGGHEGRAYIDGGCFLPQVKKAQDCNGIRLQADTGYLKYQWFAYDTTMKLLPGETKQFMYAKGPGLYQVRLISESSCTLYIDTVINDIYVILNQTITQKDPSCIGYNDGEIIINAFGGVAPYTYSINGSIAGSSSIFTGLSPGNYTCIVYDSGGCSDTVLYTLTNPPNILPNLTLVDALCFNSCNGFVQANPSGGTSSSGNYLVKFDNVFSSTQKRNNLCAGTHTVTVIDEKGCILTENFVITEPAQEIIDNVTVVDENCFNDCSGSITITDASAVEYSIDNGTTWKSTNTFNNLCSQTGNYEVAIKTVNGCIATQTVTIGQPTKLIIQSIPDEFICLNKFANKTANPSGGTPPYTYSWNSGQSTKSITESPKVSSLYNVTVTDSKGCTVIDEFNINLYPQPLASFTFSPGPVTTVFKNKVQFKNTIEYGANLKYEWYIANLANFNTKDAYFEFPTTGGKYFLNCLKVENDEGCRDSVCHELYIKYEVLLFVPNTFTPNSDNTNDVFLPIVEGLRSEDYVFYIFNRWGEVVFRTTSQTQSWDGNYKGERVKEGVYTWRIQGITKQDDEEYEKFGHITVLHKL